METTIFLMNKEDEKIVKTAIERANRAQGWNIKYEIKELIYKCTKFENQKYAIIRVDEAEHLLYLGMYMARLGF